MNSQVRSQTKVDQITVHSIQNVLDSSLKFLSSVRLGIGLMIFLATATILGTLIVQTPLAEPGQIEQIYAPQTRQVFQTLGLFDVFHAGWYISLLALLCLNITFASIDRFPATWEYLCHPKKCVDEKFIEILPLSSKLLKEGKDQVAEEALTVFAHFGFKTSRTAAPDKTVVFGEKGRYSRLSVYMVHASLLIIFAGAIIDSQFGFHAYMSLIEGENSNRAEVRGNTTVVQLPFEIRCDGAGVEHYADGTPKKWWSDLVILKKGKEVSRKRITVNDPMDYGGIRIFQSSFGSSGNPLEFGLTLRDRQVATATPIQLRLKPGEEAVIPGAGMRLRAQTFIPDFETNGNRIQSRSDQANNPALRVEIVGEGGIEWTLWVLQKIPGFRSDQGSPFEITLDEVRMSNYTGLQLARQPGQNIIWVGCFLLIAGLIYSFYFSHQRIWAILRMNEKGQSVMDLGGIASKNKLGFEKIYRSMEQDLKGPSLLVPLAGKKVVARVGDPGRAQRGRRHSFWQRYDG